MRRVLLCVALGCSSSSHPVPAQTAQAAPAAAPVPVTPDAPSAPAFELREVIVRSNGTPLGAGAQLHSGDRFELVIEVSGSAYVYVLRVAPGKGISVLYPMTTTVAVSGVTRLPTSPRQVFKLDDDVGTEHLYVVATARPISEGVPAITSAVEQIEATAAPEEPPASAPPPPADAGAPASATPPREPVQHKRPAKQRPPRTTTRVASTDVVDDLRRDVVVVSDDGSVTCADVKPNERGVAACRFTIQHLP